MSNAHEGLKDEERGKPAWVFKITKSPPSITIGRGGEYIHVLSEVELRDVMRGYFPKEYYMDVLVDTESGERVYIKHLIDLSRYTWLPKYMYVRFLRATCEVLGIPYKAEMVEAVTSKRLSPRAVMFFPEKSLIEKAETRTAEIKEREEAINREIAKLRVLMESLKEEKK